MLHTAPTDALNRLPTWCWNIAAGITGVAFAFAAQVSRDDFNTDTGVQAATVALSLLFAYSVRRGTGWAWIGDGMGQAWKWISSGRRGEMLIVVLILCGGWAVLYPIFDNARTEAGGRTKPQLAVSQLTQYGLALSQYAEDYDETLPPDLQARTVYPLLAPYLRASVNDNDRVSGFRFTWRQSLSGKKLSNLGNRADLITAYTAIPFTWKKWNRAVLFLDGRAKLLSETRFQALMRETELRTTHPVRPTRNNP